MSILLLQNRRGLLADRLRDAQGAPKAWKREQNKGQGEEEYSRIIIFEIERLYYYLLEVIRILIKFKECQWCYQHGFLLIWGNQARNTTQQKSKIKERCLFLKLSHIQTHLSRLPSFNHPQINNIAFIIPNNHILFETMQSHPWTHLEQHYQTLKNHHLKELLRDQQRNSSFLTEYEDIIFDYTHEKIIPETIHTHFPQLVNKANLKQKIQGLFNGDKINFTENRAVLHTCLRAPLNSDLHDSTRHEMRTILDNVHGVLKNIREFSERVRSGAWTGATGKQLVNLIVIGIGGSYLSIEFVYEALRSHPEYKNLAAGRRIRFLANVDPIDLDRATDGLNPQETLILVNSKTFTTAETLLNAKSCKQWLINQYAQINVTDVALIAEKHICACSTNIAETSKFGINSNNVFGFWDFVGGRFSVWSAIGVVPLAIHFGFDTASQFLSGGHSIDRLLLREESIEKNIPLLLGLIGLYRTAVQGYSSRAIIPYCQALCKFAPHIQQLDMESNGKRVNSKGEIVSYPTAVVNFGEPGTNGQHSFFQLLHQGRVTPVEFIGFTQSQQPYSVVNDPVNNHDELMSNFFSQPDALAIGKTKEQLIAEKTPAELLSHKEFTGDRPSSSILFRGELDAYKCGQLLALYEHRTSVQGFIWDVNSYDQYGVELGKVLAKTVRGILQEGKGELLAKSNINSATKRLINEYLANK